MKKVAIVQSNYIPWKGYFDLIAGVDEFILFDTMQYTRRDWRNRNLIKTPQGLRWLSIPVEVKGKYFQAINQTRVSDPGWARSHWRSLAQNYRKAPYFRSQAERFEALYSDMREEFLSKINQRFIRAVCGALGIHTPITWASEQAQATGKTERLVALCRAAGADCYLSGPAARDYLEPALFERAGIALEYMDYSGYPEYPQLYGSFEHGVSVLDLIFNAGPRAAEYMKFVRAAGATRGSGS